MICSGANELTTTLASQRAGVCQGAERLPTERNSQRADAGLALVLACGIPLKMLSIRVVEWVRRAQDRRSNQAGKKNWRNATRLMTDRCSPSCAPIVGSQAQRRMRTIPKRWIPFLGSPEHGVG